MITDDLIGRTKRINQNKILPYCAKGYESLDCSRRSDMMNIKTAKPWLLFSRIF